MSWRRWRGVVHIAVLLAFGCLLCLSPSQVQAGTPDDSYTIERYYNEAVNQQSTDNTTFVDAVTLTFTPPTSKDYLVIVSALTNNDSTSYSTVVQLVEDTTSYSITHHKPVDASLNWRSFGAHKVFSLTGSTSYTFKIQYRTELGDGTATAYIKRAAIAIVEVTNDYNAVQETEISTTSTSYVDAGTATFAFTPPVQADYLILVTANLASDTAGKKSYAQWIFGPTGSEVTDSELINSGTEYMSWGAVEKENLTNQEYTFKIQYHSKSPASAKIKNVRITAVLLTDFGNAQYAESEAESRTTSITYVDKTTLIYTPASRSDHLEFSSGLGRQESESHAFFANLDIDGTSEGEYVYVHSDGAIYRPFIFVHKQNTPGGASHSHKIQWRTNNSSSSSEAFIKNANILHFEINTAESYNDSAHTAVDNNFTSGENTVYIWAHSFKASSTYAVAYYDASTTGGGQKVATDSGPSTVYGNLSSQYVLTTDPNAAPGTWHVCVFDSAYGSPPTNYNDAATAAGYVVEDSFVVTSEAIPEFPTVMTAIMVAGLCFGIYYGMRRRKLAYVKD